MYLILRLSLPIMIVLCLALEALLLLSTLCRTTVQTPVNPGLGSRFRITSDLALAAVSIPPFSLRDSIPGIEAVISGLRIQVLGKYSKLFRWTIGKISQISSICNTWINADIWWAIWAGFMRKCYFFLEISLIFRTNSHENGVSRLNSQEWNVNPHFKQIFVKTVHI